jgi:hypothetical protein
VLRRFGLRPKRAISAWGGDRRRRRLDIPTLPEFRAPGNDADLCAHHAGDTEVGASRIQFKNLAKQTRGQLEAASFDKRCLASIPRRSGDARGDAHLWLPNRLTALADVSDRFHLKPLLRAIIFPHTRLVLRCLRTRCA